MNEAETCGVDTPHPGAVPYAPYLDGIAGEQKIRKHRYTTIRSSLARNTECLGGDALWKMAMACCH